MYKTIPFYCLLGLRDLTEQLDFNLRRYFPSISTTEHRWNPQPATGGGRTPPHGQTVALGVTDHPEGPYKKSEIFYYYINLIFIYFKIKNNILLYFNNKNTWHDDDPRIFPRPILTISWRPLQFKRTGEDPDPLLGGCFFKI